MQTKFAIRSGGHNYNLNHSSVGPVGILVDLINFNQTILSKDKSVLTAGSGARWGAVYDALNNSDVPVNGGRSPKPVIGKQTLGGGIGWFSNVAGANGAGLVYAEVVLANGTVVHRDKESQIFYGLSKVAGQILVLEQLSLSARFLT